MTKKKEALTLPPDRYIAAVLDHKVTERRDDPEFVEAWGTWNLIFPNRNLADLDPDDVVARATYRCKHCYRTKRQHIGTQHQCYFQPTNYRAIGLENIGALWRRMNVTTPEPCFCLGCLAMREELPTAKPADTSGSAPREA